MPHTLTSGWWKILAGLLLCFPLWTVYVFSKAVFKNFYQIHMEYITQTRRARKGCIIFLGPRILVSQFIRTCWAVWQKFHADFFFLHLVPWRWLAWDTNNLWISVISLLLNEHLSLQDVSVRSVRALSVWQCSLFPKSGFYNSSLA